MTPSHTITMPTNPIQWIQFVRSLPEGSAKEKLYPMTARICKPLALGHAAYIMAALQLRRDGYDEPTVAPLCKLLKLSRMTNAGVTQIAKRGWLVRVISTNAGDGWRIPDGRLAQAKAMEAALQRLVEKAVEAAGKGAA